MKIIDAAKNKIHSCKERIEEFKTEHPKICLAVNIIGASCIYAAGIKTGCGIGRKEGRKDLLRDGCCFDLMRTVNYKYNKYPMNNGRHGDAWNPHDDNELLIRELEKEIINYKE